MLDERTNESCFKVGWADNLRLVGWLFVGGLFLHKHASMQAGPGCILGGFVRLARAALGGDVEYRDIGGNKRESWNKVDSLLAEHGIGPR